MTAHLINNLRTRVTERRRKRTEGAECGTPLTTGLVMRGVATSLHLQRRIPIDELSAISQATFICYIDKVTNKISNSPVQQRPCHQVSLADALSPPSFPTRPGSSIQIVSRSEESLMEENDAPLWTGEELTSRRTCFVQHLATTADRLDGM